MLFALLVGLVQLGSAPLVQSQEPNLLDSLKALKAMNDGQQLVGQGKPKSIYQGIDKYKEAATLFHSIGLPQGETAALAALGMAYSILGEWENSIKYLNQAIPLARSLKEPVMEGTTLAALAFTYTSSNQYPKAIAAYEEGLALFQRPADQQERTVRGGLLQGLGMNYVQMGEQKKGFYYLEQALALKRELRDLSGEAQVLIVMGASYLHLGQSEKALDYDNRALAIAQSLSNKHLEALAFGVLGGVYREMGQNEKALEYFNRELNYRQSLDDQPNIAASLVHIAGVYQNMNETAKALSYLNQALQINATASP